MSLTNPIIVIGIERSGTTLIYSILANHPDLYWLSRLDSLFPAFPTLTCFIRRTATFFVGEEKYAAIPNVISKSKGLIPPSECLPYWSRIFNWGDEKDYKIDGDYVDEKGLNGRTKKMIFEDLNKRLNLMKKRRFLVKQTGFSLKIRYLNALFPGAFFLHIVRNPLDNLVSLVKAKQKTGEKFWGTKFPGWGQFIDVDPITQAALQIKEVTDIVERDIKRISNPANCYTLIKYEDLVNNPRTVVPKILKLCELGQNSRVEELAVWGIQRQNIDNKSLLTHMSSEIREIIESIAIKLGYVLD